MKIKYLLFTIILTTIASQSLATAVPLTDADVLQLASTLNDIDVSDAGSTEALLETYAQSTNDQQKKAFAFLTEAFIDLSLASESSKAKGIIDKLNGLTLTDWQEFYRDCARVKIASLDKQDRDAINRIDALLSSYSKISNNTANPMCQALKTGLEHEQGDLRAEMLLAKADCLKDLGELAQAKGVANQIVSGYSTSNWAVQAKAEYK